MLIYAAHVVVRLRLLMSSQKHVLLHPTELTDVVSLQVLVVVSSCLQGGVVGCRLEVFLGSLV